MESVVLFLGKKRNTARMQKDMYDLVSLSDRNIYLQLNGKAQKTWMNGNR